MSEAGPVVMNAPEYPGRMIYWQYKARMSIIFGVIQLIAAIPILAIIVAIRMTDPSYAYAPEYAMGTAIYLIICGILAIITGKRKTQCMILATLILTMCVAGCSTLLLMRASHAVTIMLMNEEEPKMLTLVLYATLMIITLAAMILSLVLSCFGCGALCCRCCVNSENPPSSQTYYSDPSARVSEKERMA